MARTAVQEPSVETAEEYSANIPETPVFATDYDANGEAVDRPVDTRPDTQSGLPLYEGWADNGWMVKSGYVEEPA